MRRSLGLATLLVLSLGSAVVGPPASAAQEVPPAPPTPAGAAVPGELLVRFDPASTARSAAGAGLAAAAVGGRVVQSLDAAAPGLQHIALDGDADVSQAIAELEARPDVLYAEPNYQVQADAVPNDSRFGELWGLHNTGQQTGNQVGTPDADIDAPEAWNTTTGSADVTVAVIDGGIAYDHPDLAPNMWVNADEVAGNGVDDDGNGFVDDRRGWDFVGRDNDPGDEDGHGTHVAGTIGARGNNDAPGAGTTDVAGVAWNVRLMPVRVLNEFGEGSNAALIAGADYARRNGARVVNMSLGTRFPAQALFDTMAGSDVTWVVSAGNDSSDLGIAEQYPCEFDLPNIVCVASTDSHDELAFTSNFGTAEVDVAAPGVDILSTWAFSRVFFDDFQTPIAGRWVTGGTPNTWATTSAVPPLISGTWLTDSPAGNYPDNADNWARTGPFDLRGKRACMVSFRGYIDILDSNFDFLRVEVATSTAGPWTEILGLSTLGFDLPFSAHLPASFDGVSAAYLRFRMDADEEFGGNGAYVDDVALDCSGTYSAGSYRYLSGTSMATPQVAGVAALVLARNPSFSTAQVRSKLLASVDTKASLADKVVTGGRINAAKAVSATSNAPPTADAGPDKTAKPSSEVSLPGRGTDPEGGALTYLWLQVSGTPVTLRNASSATASFTAPVTNGPLTFRLRVTDPQGASTTDDVIVTVQSK